MAPNIKLTFKGPFYFEGHLKLFLGLGLKIIRIFNFISNVNSFLLYSHSKGSVSNNHNITLFLSNGYRAAGILLVVSHFGTFFSALSPSRRRKVPLFKIRNVVGADLLTLKCGGSCSNYIIKTGCTYKYKKLFSSSSKKYLM